MSEFPRGWSTRVIEEICDIHDYRRIPLSSEERRERKGPYPYYGANNIQDRIDDFIFDFDAVLIAEDGGYYDEHEYRDIAQYATGKYWVNNHAHILTGKPGLDTRFLYYALVRKNICPWINTGTRSKLNQSDLKQIELLVPPLPEQKKIAEILSGIDALSEKITTKIDKLKNLKVALICEFLSEGARKAEMTSSDGGDFQGNCEWKMLPVSAIADFISGYAFSSTDFIDTGILCIRMGNLYQNKFHENRASVFLPSEYLTKNPRYQVEAGDLLISMTGTAGKRDYGFVVEVPNGTSKGLLNQRVGKIVPKTNHSKGYIKEVMRSPFYLEQLYEYGSGTKQANLTAGQIMGIIFPVPNLPTQLRIAQSLSTIQKKIDSLAVLSCKQIALLLSIRNELLSGRKRVSNARVLDGVGV